MISNFSAQKLKQNEEVFRKINDSIEEIEEKTLTVKEQARRPIEFVCECSQEDCFDRIFLTIPEYKNLRSRKQHYIIKNGHETPEVEIILSKFDDYAVVEKTV